MGTSFKNVVLDFVKDPGATICRHIKAAANATGCPEAVKAASVAVDTKVAQNAINKDISDRLGKIEKRSRMIATATDKQLKELSLRVEALESSGRAAKKKRSKK